MACGKLVSDPHNYGITSCHGSVRITIENEPNPNVLTMRPHGGLIRPGLVDVKRPDHKRLSLCYDANRRQLPRLARPMERPVPDRQPSPPLLPAIARCVIGLLTMPPLPNLAAGSSLRCQPRRELTSSSALFWVQTSPVILRNALDPSTEVQESRVTTIVVASALRNNVS